MRLVLRQLIILCALAIVPAIVAGMVHPHRPSWALGPGEVRVITARQWGRGVLWVDARSPELFLRDHIPGALPLNQGMWAELSPAVRAAAKGKRVVIYCESGPCDAGHALAERLKREAGVGEEVYVLNGGFRAWNDAMR
jgi:rhodanese-related sulfurtransferase